MKSTLDSLPSNLHYEISKYLAASEIQNLSNVCSALLDVYRPISLKNCLVTPCDDISALWLKHRRIPGKVLLEPLSYSYFLRNAVVQLIIDIQFSITCQNSSKPERHKYKDDLFKSTLSRLEYSSLRSVRLVCDHTVNHDQYLMKPKYIEQEDFQPFLDSNLYASLAFSSSQNNSKNYQLKLPTSFSYPILLAPTAVISNSVTPSSLTHWKDTPSKSLFSNIERLSLFYMEESLLHYFINIAQTLPNLRNMDFIMRAIWSYKTVILPNSIEYLKRLPENLTAVSLTLVDAASSVPKAPEFRGLDDSLDEIIIPQITHLNSDISLRCTSDNFENILALPGLKSACVFASFPCSITSNESLNIHNLVFLELEASRHFEYLVEENTFAILNRPKKFSKLKTLNLILDTTWNPTPEFKISQSILSQVRNHYKTTKRKPSIKWLTDRIQGVQVYPSENHPSQRLNHAYQRTLIKLLTEPLKAARTLKNCNVDVWSCEDQYTQMCLLEAVAQQMLKVSSLEYFSVDFRGPGFVSPGLYRILNFHPNLKQALIKVELLSVNEISLLTKGAYDLSLDYMLADDYSIESGATSEWGHENKYIYHSLYNDLHHILGTYLDEYLDEDENYDANIGTLQSLSSLSPILDPEDYSTVVFDSSYKNLHISAYQTPSYGTKKSPDPDDVNYYCESSPVSARIYVDVARKRTFTPNSPTTFTEFPISRNVLEKLSPSSQSDLYVSGSCTEDGREDTSAFAEFNGWI